MHGNLWEWVFDAYLPDAYARHAEAAAVDPFVETAPDNRHVFRGETSATGGQPSFVVAQYPCRR